METQRLAQAGGPAHAAVRVDRVDKTAVGNQVQAAIRSHGRSGDQATGLFRHTEAPAFQARSCLQGVHHPSAVRLVHTAFQAGRGASDKALSALGSIGPAHLAIRRQGIQAQVLSTDEERVAVTQAGRSRERGAFRQEYAGALRPVPVDEQHSPIRADRDEVAIWEVQGGVSRLSIHLVFAGEDPQVAGITVPTGRAHPLVSDHRAHSCNARQIVDLGGRDPGSHRVDQPQVRADSPTQIADRPRSFG